MDFTGFPPTDKSFAGNVGDILDRISRVERRRLPERLLPGGSDVESSYRGTTAERDALWGIPATDPDRVALANRKIIWLNTDSGWEESYYATAGLPGLTVRGLFAGVSAGWFPVGIGPWAIQRPTATFAATTNNYVQGWNGQTERNGGNAWFLHNTVSLGIMKPGRYDLSVRTVQTTGSGTVDWYMRLDNTTQTAPVNNWQGIVVPLNSGLFTEVQINIPNHLVTSTQYLKFLASGSAALTVHQASNATFPRGHMSARYIGPPLVTD